MTCTSKATDQLPFVEPRTTVQAAYGALSALQSETPGTQLGACVVLFLALVEELKLDVSQLLNQASRIATDDDTFYRPEMRALKAYIQGELK
jgi:hypothetical protein